MRANIPKLPMGAVKIFPDMSEADVRAWNRTEPYRMREYEAMANAMLISMLYYLMTEEHYGAVKLRRAWEGMIRRRAEANEARMAVVDDEFLDLINDAFTEDVAPRAEWISVDERLPKVAGREYLVWDDVQKTVKKRIFYRLPPSIPVETYPYLREYFGNCADYKRYTHWMPLPEPPQMKGGAG